jgi:hypothetical protein
MQVQKRDGTLIEVSFDKVTTRLRILCNKEPKLFTIDPIEIAQKVCSQIYSGIPTSKLDELSAEICISNTTKHLEYGVLASRIMISNNHKLTPTLFSDAAEILYTNKDSLGGAVPLISKEVYDIVQNNKEKINFCLVNKFYKDKILTNMIKDNEDKLLISEEARTVSRPSASRSFITPPLCV